MVPTSTTQHSRTPSSARIASAMTSQLALSSTSLPAPTSLAGLSRLMHLQTQQVLPLPSTTTLGLVLLVCPCPMPPAPASIPGQPWLSREAQALALALATPPHPSAAAIRLHLSQATSQLPSVTLPMTTLLLVPAPPVSSLPRELPRAVPPSF